MTDTINSYYTVDHDRLDGLLKQFQQTKEEDFEQAKKFFRDFKTGLERHIAWEEEILFPVFEEKTGMHEGGPTAVMRYEHQQIKHMLNEIHGKIHSGKTESELEESVLLSVLSNHNMKEENILYPALDNFISEPERAEIFRKMEDWTDTHRHESCCGGH